MLSAGIVGLLNNSDSTTTAIILADVSKIKLEILLNNTCLKIKLLENKRMLIGIAPSALEYTLKFSPNVVINAYLISSL